MMENYSNSINSSQEKIKQLFGENENARSAYIKTYDTNEFSISSPVTIRQNLNPS